MIDGIRFRERTRIAWRHVPARYGHWRTVYGRYRLWTRDGTWQRITTALATDADTDTDAGTDAGTNAGTNAPTSGPDDAQPSTSDS